jgi:Tfp pilus assembly protein PilF
MKRNNPRKSKKPLEVSQPSPQQSATRWISPVVVAAGTLACFVPALWNDFVDWDDDENLVRNLHYRGLGWRQLYWMFTTFHMGHYQPLSWVTFGLDYLLWGMNPFGYHLTNVVLHTANAVFFYFIVKTLLALALAKSKLKGTWQLQASAGFAALLFAIHPLRAESVAWATERRDVLSGFFYLGAIYFYLRAAAISETVVRRRWLIAAVVVYVLSLLSKATAMTLPLVLVLLDVYPLARLKGGSRNWFAQETRALWWEKIAFIVPAVIFALIALLAQYYASALRPFQNYDLASRLAQAFVGICFYLWKTVVPVRLSPLYEIAPDFTPWDSQVLLSVFGTIGVTAALFLLRKRWPMGLACWLYYLVVLAPMLGVVQSGPQLVADRYSYLACLSWAVLAGGALLWSVRFRWKQNFIGAPSVVPAVSLAALTALAVLGFTTWKQVQIWRDTGTLWSHVVKLNQYSSIAHYNLGRFLAQQGQHTEAIAHYREALRIRPGDAETHNNLGLLLAIRGEVEASLAEFQKAARISPSYARAFFNMGRVFATQGELDKAVENYQQALKLEPNESEIHLGLGTVLAKTGDLEEASKHFQQAVKLKPEFADAHVQLGRVLAAQGRKDEAAKHYEQALRILQSTSEGRDAR